MDFSTQYQTNRCGALIHWPNLSYDLIEEIIRNDNGSQFITHRVRQALQDLEEKELMDRFDIQSFFKAKEHIRKYMHRYNNVRRHRILKGLTLAQKWIQGHSQNLVRQHFEPDTT